MKNILLYALSFFLVILLFEFWRRGFFISIIFMLVTIFFVFPHSVAWLEEKINYQFNTFQLGAIGVLTFMAAFYFSEMKSSENKAADQAKNEEAQKPDVPQEMRVGVVGTVFYDANGKEVAPDLVYDYEQRIDDTPLKTQVNITAWIESSKFPYTVNQVQEIMKQRYEGALTLKDFKHRKKATHYAIEVRPDQESAKRTGDGAWIGLLIWIHGKTEGYKFNQTMIEAVQKKPVEKFGLSEEKRKEIFKEMVGAERKALEEAKKKYDLSKMSGTPVEKMEIRGKYQGQLLERYNGNLRKKHNLTEEQIKEISREAFEKGWAMD